MTHPPAKSGPKEAKRGPGGRFAKGASGNPAGRPQGSRSRTSLALEAILEGEGERLIRKAIELALAGDPVALRACLDRLYPVPRDRRLSVDLPRPAKASDLPAIVGRLLALVAAGELTPTEGERLAALLGSWREAVELEDLEKRIAGLEAKR